MFDRSKISLLPKIISSFKARHSDVIEFLEEIHHNIKPDSVINVTIKHADDIPYTFTTTISQEDIDDINSVTK